MRGRVHFLEHGLREGFCDLVEQALAPRGLDAGLEGLGEGLGVAPGGVEDEGNLGRMGRRGRGGGRKGVRTRKAARERMVQAWSGPR